MSEPKVAVRAVGIGKRYPRVTALDNVSVTIGAGRFTAVLGPSGSGKSTLLHCLAGLDTVDTGAVYLGDTNLRSLGERQLTRLWRERVGFVFQSFNLLPTMTVAENLLLPLARPRGDLRAHRGDAYRFVAAQAAAVGPARAVAVGQQARPLVRARYRPAP